MDQFEGLGQIDERRDFAFFFQLCLTVNATGSKGPLSKTNSPDFFFLTLSFLSLNCLAIHRSASARSLLDSCGHGLASTEIRGSTHSSKVLKQDSAVMAVLFPTPKGPVK